MEKSPKDQNEFTEEEAAKRRDETLKRMLETPPKPNKAVNQKETYISNPKKGGRRHTEKS